VIKNFIKKHIKGIIYILSCLILGILFYYYIATSVLSSFVILAMGLFSIESIVATLLYPFSLLILFFAASYILYKYLMYIITCFSNKKLLKPILLLLLLAIVITICIIFNFVLSSSIKHLFLMIVYILGTIFIPLILLAIILLNKTSSKKSKVKKSILIVVLALIIYIINIPTLLVSSTYITTYISNHLSQTTQGPNLEYLNNYEQRMATKGFLYKSDVEYIINIAERRSEKVIVNYKFDDETITISNKDENFKDTITTNLKWEYYKFNYTYSNDIVTINIEKYANSQEDEEKNSNIILAGNMRNDLIQSITSENVEPTSTNFVIENSFTLTPGYRSDISNLRLLLVYDKNSNNFIPVVNNNSFVNMIDSYKITSTGISITLNSNTNLNVLDYTLRINRYDDDLTIPENKNYNYYYHYEPVVTTSTNGTGNTVLTFEFNDISSLDSINNIEIIFGNN
jgi:heme/copper-type cytochrome/quinol oxidase subunit 2